MTDDHNNFMIYRIQNRRTTEVQEMLYKRLFSLVMSLNVLHQLEFMHNELNLLAAKQDEEDVTYLIALRVTTIRDILQVYAFNATPE